jgi:GTP-binding protein YchF
VKVGIVGLPNAGKTSLFNLLTGAAAHVDSYPFTTIEKNVGVVIVPDRRLDRIGAITRPQRLTPAHVDFVDIAGLVEGASRGEGLGNKFLGHVREADLVLHLVRAFPAAGVPHVLSAVDPDRDAGIVEAELAIADLGVLERRLEHVRKEPKAPEQELLLTAMEKAGAALGRGFEPADLTVDERQSLRGLNLFATKPVLYAVNCSDTEPADPARFPRLLSRRCLLFSAALEPAMNGLSDAEKTELRTDLGLAPEGPSAIVARCFEALGLIRFYTIKGEESRAWAAPRGTTAVDAASLIHSDMAKGFVKAEVVTYDDLAAAGDYQVARQAGKVKIEGKNYVLQDGDVLHVRFRT